MTGNQPELRCADADREKVAAQLREHYAQGRLTLQEFDERTSAAYAAKTFGDLVPLTADLPMQEQPAEARPPERQGRSAVPWTPIVIGLIVAAVFVVPAIVGAVTGGEFQYGIPFWLIIPALFIFGRHRRRLGPHEGDHDGERGTGPDAAAGPRSERDSDDDR